MEHIHNLPDYARTRNYIVVRVVDNEFWFWGAWDELDPAWDAAMAIDGYVIARTEKG